MPSCSPIPRRSKVGTGVSVLPMRHDIVVAGQADRDTGPFRQGPARDRRRHRRLPRGVQGAAARLQDGPRRHRRRGPAGAEPAVQASASRASTASTTSSRTSSSIRRPLQKRIPIYVGGNNANNMRAHGEVGRRLAPGRRWRSTACAPRRDARCAKMAETGRPRPEDHRSSRRSSSCVSARRARKRARTTPRAR